MLSRFAPLAFVLTVPCYAADPTGLFTVRKQVEEARVTFSVQDARGGPVSGLTRDEVRVVNDGHVISQITSFYGYENVPLRLTILLDASDSMSRRVGDETQMARDLLRSIVRPGLDEARISSFAGRAHSVAEISQVGFQGLKAGGQTALYDAMYGEMASLNERSAGPVRRIMILFSDGEDNWSEHNLEDVIAAAQQADTAIYTITAHSHRYVYAGDRVLRQLAERTGGHAFFLRSFDKPELIYHAMQAELRAHYVLVFRPASASGFHTLTIFPRNSRLKVRSRKGYYVEPRIDP
ncbi:MAG TPA: VWA domain-containing protein [Terriglobales bacterium]|nr:VWA domain-containing protein [Terriglobales bacterium]